MYSSGQLVSAQEPKTAYIPSTSSTSISSSSASSSSYSLMPPVNLLTPPSNSLISGYKNAHTPNVKYFNTPSANIYESNQQFVFNTPATTPNVYIPTLSYYQNKTEMVIIIIIITN